MPQSPARVWLYVIFSNKERRASLHTKPSGTKRIAWSGITSSTCGGHHHAGLPEWSARIGSRSGHVSD